MYLCEEDIENIKESINEVVAINIKRIRIEKGLTQLQLAHRTLSDKQYIHKIEKQKRGVSIAKLAVIAAALDVPINDLLVDVDR